MIPKMEKSTKSRPWAPPVPKRRPKGATGHQNGAKKVQNGTKMDPKDTKTKENWPPIIKKSTKIIQKTTLQKNSTQFSPKI